MTDELACAVALLHDVAEDTAVSLEALAQQFPPEVMGPLRLLTRMSGQAYMDYIKALCADPIARRVKIADLCHNLQRPRLIGVESVHAANLERRYIKALSYILDHR